MVGLDIGDILSRESVCVQIDQIAYQRQQTAATASYDKEEALMTS
jgi:hypothetical protein